MSHHTITKLLAVPVQLWQQWYKNSSELRSGLRPILNAKIFMPLSGLSSRIVPAKTALFLTKLTNCRPRCALRQLDHSEALLRLINADSDISWLIPSAAQLLPDLDALWCLRIIPSQPSNVPCSVPPSVCGLVGYPTFSSSRTV